MNYIPRIVEAKCLQLFSKYPVITLTGPRQSGNTSLVRHVFPDLTSWIQVIVDDRGKNGLFILTESRQFEDTEAVSQSLPDERP